MSETNKWFNDPHDTDENEHIAKNLKLVYDTIQDEPLPERFVKLLEQLKNKEKS